jgi:hypothetical protein
MASLLERPGGWGVPQARRELVVRLWNEAVAEAGKGEPGR